MLASKQTILFLGITCFIFLLLIFFLSRKKNKNQTHKLFIWLCILLAFWLIELILQAVLSDPLNINPIYFDYLVYINTCLLPVIFLLLSISFTDTKFKYNKKYLSLFIVPIISLLVLWTNDFHHLFYKEYSINLSDSKIGPFLIVHSIYTYILLFIGIIKLAKYSIKNSGFFSKQSILIIIGALISIFINIFGTLGLIKMSIYVTPMSFAIAFLFFALAIFKFDFLKVAPIALQKVVDRMSDGYIIVNDENIVTDFNQTFLELFSLKTNELRNININDLITKLSNNSEKRHTFLDAINKTKSDDTTIKIESYFSQLNKYFNIEISGIKNKNTYLGTLILFKDITQHTLDMKTIKDNQDILVEKERLASLGQMIGGIAHNLKTPIMSIAGATEGLSDLIKEYDSSIEDPEVNFQDHHEIASDMSVWIEKIRTHLSYMSDVITAIKGQAVNFADQTSTSFTVKELISYVDILMKHELKNALINLKSQADIDVGTEVRGNINSLVQVINNIISNAIQAYQSRGETNKDIDFRIYKENSNIIFKVQDYAGGLPEKVQEKLFKEMITTKGKNGTGLGLFMSYSNIKAHFSGNLRYETSSKGTSFYVEIPM